MCKTNALQGLKHIPEKQQTGWKYQYEWNKQTNKPEKSYLCIIPLLCKYSRAQTISAE